MSPSWTPERNRHQADEGERFSTEREVTHQPRQQCTCPTSLLEQLQDANDYVVDVTKPRSLPHRENQTALEAAENNRCKNIKDADTPHYLKLLGMM